MGWDNEIWDGIYPPPYKKTTRLDAKDGYSQATQKRLLDVIGRK